MTGLESKNRLLQRHSLFRFRNTNHTLTKYKQPWTTRAEETSRLRPSSSSSRSFLYSRPVIDDITLKVIRFEVEQQQQQQQQQQPILSMSVFDLATLLLGSVHVLDVYAEQEDTIHLGGGRFKSWIRKCHANHSKMGRKYQLTNAFQKLQASKNAQSTMLGSWEEVVAALQTVVELPTTFTQQQQQQENDDEDDAIAMQDFTHRMAKIRLQTIQEQQTSSIGLRTSQHLWQQVATSAKAASDHSNIRFDEEAIALTLEKETAKAQELADLRIHDIELRRLEKEREEEARQRAQKLLRPLSNQERNRVHDAMDERLGSDDDIVAQNGVDNIQRKSLRTLSPGEWLNDEVIHYFLGTLAERDAQLCAQQTGRARSHFFKSFFMTKLRNEGDQTGKHGVYEYRNVKRWSKNVPGKDIFKLEKIFFPINQNNMHWTLAVAFMKQKRIQFYDSMGGDGMVYLKDIFQYLQDEHREKKGCALPDLDQWTLAPCTKDTPRQLNGYDCGVFTCMFADFLSKDDALLFGQQHVTQCRERIALSILNGQAIM